MLSAKVRSALAQDVSFRLVLNQLAESGKPLAESDKPLSDWIVWSVVSDTSFESLLRDALKSVSSELDPERMTSLGRTETVATFGALGEDKRLALLIAENIKKSHDQFRLLIWIRSRLEGLWNHNGGPSTKTQSGIFRGLAFLLGAATITAAGSAWIQSREFSREVETLSKQYSQVRQEISQISERSLQTTEKIETIRQDTQRTKEVLLQQTVCPSARKVCGRVVDQQFPNPWVIKLDGSAWSPNGQPQNTNNNNFSGSPGALPPPLAQLPNPWTIKLEGLPTLPASLRLQPNYRVESLPSSTYTLIAGKEVTLKVEYPISYEVTDDCLFKITLTKVKDPAEFKFERDSSCRIERIATEGSVTMKLNQKPVYVPDMDAFVSLTSRRQGLFGLGKREDPEIFVQAASYSPRNSVSAAIHTVDNTDANAIAQDAGH